MIRQNEHFILIPKGAGKFYRVPKNEIFVETYWGGQIVYRILKQTSTRTFFNEEVCIELRDFIICYAELEEVMYGHVGSGWHKQPSLKCTEKRYLIPWQSRGRRFESHLLHNSVKCPFIGAFFFADKRSNSR